VQHAVDLDYEALLRFRVAMREFSHWSEQQAAAVGLTHAQHQLLLAVKGHPDPKGPTIGDVAGYLLIRHHSAVELAGRTETLGFIKRQRDKQDRRVVRLALTARGERSIKKLTSAHLRELRTLGPALRGVTEESGGLPRQRVS